LNITVTRLLADFAEIRILGEPVEIAIAEVQRLFQREDGPVEVVGEGITAGQIVKNERVARFERARRSSTFKPSR
jgi:hypothetical protein